MKIKKLTLKKEIITSLSGVEMSNLKGGDQTTGFTGTSAGGTSNCICESNLSYCPGAPDYGGGGSGNNSNACGLSYGYCPWLFNCNTYKR